MLKDPCKTLLLWEDTNICKCGSGTIFPIQDPYSVLDRVLLTGLTNKTPSPLIGNRTPYELLYQAPIDYTSFRVFGCLTFASTLLAHRTKFQPRAKVCVFLSYPPGMKTYKLYDVQSKEIIISLDADFMEKYFLFVHPIALILFWSSLSSCLAICYSWTLWSFTTYTI